MTVCNFIVLYAQTTFSYKTLCLKIEMLSKLCTTDASYLLLWKKKLCEVSQQDNRHIYDGKHWRMHVRELIHTSFPSIHHFQIYLNFTISIPDYVVRLSLSVVAFIFVFFGWITFMILYHRLYFSFFQCFETPGISCFGFLLYFVFQVLIPFRPSVIIRLLFLNRYVRQTYLSSLLVLFPEPANKYHLNIYKRYKQNLEFSKWLMQVLVTGEKQEEKLSKWKTITPTGDTGEPVDLMSLRW